MQENILKLKVVTPLYNRGTEDDVGLKIPSLRGVLRFWWRALQSENNIPRLKLEEQLVFGGISGNALASPVKFRLIKEPDSEPIPFSKSTVSGNAKYLSLGIFGMGAELDRLCIESGSYHVAMQYPQELYHDLRQALLAFHYFGNLGAKARNGFGSLYLENFREFCDDLSDTPAKFLKSIELSTTLPHYSAFSDKTLLFESKETFATGGDALASISKMYKGMRATVGNHEYEPIERKNDYSIRKYLSFPIGPGVKEMHIFRNTNGRYSKPYFFKVYQQAPNEYKVLVLNLLHEYAFGLDDSSQSYNHKVMNNPHLQAEFEYACKQFNQKLVNEHNFRRVK